jgi:hypothetical protein
VELAVDDGVDEALQRHDGRVQHVQRERRLAREGVVAAVHDGRQPAQDEARDVDREVVHHGVVGVVGVVVLVRLEALLHVDLDQHEERGHGDAARDDPQVEHAEHPPELLGRVVLHHDPAPEAGVPELVEDEADGGDADRHEHGAGDVPLDLLHEHLLVLAHAHPAVQVQRHDEVPRDGRAVPERDDWRSKSQRVNNENTKECQKWAAY